MEYPCVLVSLRKHRNLMKTFRLIKTKHQVHILYRLTCSALYKIVKCAHGDYSVCSLIYLEVDIHIIAALNPSGLRTYILVENPDKSLICIVLIVCGSHCIVINLLLEVGICCHKYSSVHRNKVWSEVDNYRTAICISKLLLYLRGMSVCRNTISLYALIDLTVEICDLRASSCT